MVRRLFLIRFSSLLLATLYRVSPSISKIEPLDWLTKNARRHLCQRNNHLSCLSSIQSRLLFPLLNAHTSETCCLLRYSRIMSSAVSLEQLPDGFETLPVYKQSKAIPGATSLSGVLGVNGIRAFRHVSSAVRFVIFSAPGPLVSATVIVGTEPISNAGHPHTLEHIVFLGSQRYPHRGYLDNLACRCISDGTNAWTDNEFTAYTATTAGLDGFLNLLPCYLDHILRPKINRAAFDSEVYHIRQDGKEAGVVFCEMQARENTEADLAEIALHSILFDKTPLALTSGGLCSQIRELTNEDIEQFHRNQYCGANVSVVIGGSDVSADALLSSVKPLLDEIAANPGFSPGRPRWQTPLLLDPLSLITRKVVPFPSNDHTIGSIVLGWRGPGATEKLMKAAVDVLLRYLAGDIWSPLRQRFVEVENQLASDIDAFQETFLDTGSFVLSFQGVDHSEEDEEEEGVEEADPEEVVDIEEEERKESFLLSGKLENMVMNLLNGICESGELPGGIRGIHSVIKKEKENLLSEFESGSHSAVPHYLIEELVYGERGSLVIGEEARGFLSHYDALKQKDEGFWISVLRTLFVDSPRVELIMVPDESLAERLAEEEHSALEKRVKELGEDALRSIGRENEERVTSLKAVKFQTESFPPMPSAMSISRFPYSVSCHNCKSYLSQAVALETDFVHCTLLFNTERLKTSDRMMLPVLCDLIPTCDILLEDGCYIQYTDNARAISDATISSDGSCVFLGYQNAMAQQCVGVHFVASPESFEEAAELVLRTFFQSEVTVERVAAVSQTLMANCTAEMREGDSVLAAASSLIPYLETKTQWRDDLPNFTLANFIGSYPLMSFLSEEFSNRKARKRVRQNVINKMHNTLDALRNLPKSDIMVQITAQEPDGAQDVLASLWNKKSAKFGTQNGNGFDSTEVLQESSELPVIYKPCGTLGSLLDGRVVGTVVGIGGVESSFLETRVDSDVFVGHSDWAALSVLLEMLCRVEGPLSDAVRVSGLAYGVQIQKSAFMGQLCLSIFESSSLAAAWDAVCECLEEFRCLLDREGENGAMIADLDTSKASVLFSLNRGRSSPEHIATGVLSRCAFRAPSSPLADQALEEQVEQVALICLKRVFDERVKPLYTAKHNRIVVATCGQSIVAETIEEFGKCKWPIELADCAIEDLYPKAVRSFVKSLKK